VFGGIKYTYYLTILVNTCSDGSRAYVRQTKAHGPSSRVCQAWDRLIKELKNIIKRKRQTLDILLYAPLTNRGETKISCLEKQIKILGENETNKASTCNSNFNLEEGPAWVLEEESDPEENPNIYYDLKEDRVIFKP